MWLSTPGWRARQARAAVLSLAGAWQEPPSPALQPSLAPCFSRHQASAALRLGLTALPGPSFTAGPDEPGRCSSVQLRWVGSLGAAAVRCGLLAAQFALLSAHRLLPACLPAHLPACAPHAETNAAVNKPLSASSLSNNRGGASITLQSLVDNNASTCVAVQADAGSPDNPTTGEAGGAAARTGWEGSLPPWERSPTPHVCLQLVQPTFTPSPCALRRLLMPCPLLPPALLLLQPGCLLIWAIWRLWGR